MLCEKINKFFNGLHSQKKSPESSTTQQRSPSFSDMTSSTKADNNPASTYQNSVQALDCVETASSYKGKRHYVYLGLQEIF